MHGTGLFSRLVALLTALLFALPAAAYADDFGWPYRGPNELSGSSDDDEDDDTPGSGNEDEETDPNDPNNPDDPNDPNNPDDPGGGTGAPSTGPKGPGPGGKGSVIDGKILWSWWWEHNKDRYLARATERGRVNAGSIQYWFGSGAKYPPRDINPVSDAQRRRIYDTLVKRLGDKNAAVRNAACIALGRLQDIPATEAEAKAATTDDKVTNNMCARSLLKVVRTEKNDTVKASALLGIGMTGDAKACQTLMRIFTDLDVRNHQPYALIAFGLARHADAVGLVVEKLPKSAQKKEDVEIAAIHALGLYGPEFVEEIEKNKTAYGKRNGIEHVMFLAKSSGNDAIPVQAITTLGRLQTGLKAVKKATSNKSLAVKWAAILALAQYDATENQAKDAASALLSKFKGTQQTKNFIILASGDLAGRLDPNSKTRAKILKWLHGKTGLESNDNYTRACSALALAVANDHTSAPAIADLLQNTTVDHYVAGACSVSLGLLKAAEHADLVIKRVVNGKYNADAKGYGLVGLALMGDTTRIDDITTKAKTNLPKEAARQAPLAIGVLGDRKQARRLTNYFKNSFKTKERVPVSNAVFGLSWIRDAGSVDELINLTGNNEPSVRGMSTIALGYIGSPNRVSALTRCFESANFRKRFAGWRVLYRIAGIL
ncbi:MAG: HEAT repeat domain-containing protein [Planctomycetota bacterium]